MQRAGACRGDTHVRRQAAVRIDFVGGKRQHRPVHRRRAQPFQRAEKELDITDRLIDVAVARNDVEDHRMRLSVRGSGDKKRLCGRRQARHRARRHIHSAADDSGFEDGAQVEGGGRRHDLSV